MSDIIFVVDKRLYGVHLSRSIEEYPHERYPPSPRPHLPNVQKNLFLVILFVIGIIRGFLRIECQPDANLLFLEVSSVNSDSLRRTSHRNLGCATPYHETTQRTCRDEKGLTPPETSCLSKTSRINTSLRVYCTT